MSEKTEHQTENPQKGLPLTSENIMALADMIELIRQGPTSQGRVMVLVFPDCVKIGEVTFTMGRSKYKKGRFFKSA